MSRSDEEGFHPHPGDPWHPGWAGDREEDPSAPRPEDDAPEDDAPKKGRGDTKDPRRRGLFGRRKGKAEGLQEDEAPEEFADEAGLPEPGGWGAFDDEVVVADLETIAPESAPSWTDEGGSSVEFESAFTVGGELLHDAEPDAAGEPLPAPEEGGTEDGAAEPTEILGAVPLPDLPDLPELTGGEEPAEPLAVEAEEPVEAEAPEEPKEPVEAPREDLARALQEATAVLGARNGDEAVEIAAGEFDAVEVSDDAAQDDGYQDSLLTAGLDLEDGEETRAPDPGFTPEPDDDDGTPPWEAPGAEAGDDTEIVPVEDVDAALAAMASEPIAAADQGALDALRALGEDDDDEQWHAFAEGEGLAPPDVVEDLSAPEEPPDVSDSGVWLDPAEEPEDLADEEPRGFFARRRARKEEAGTGEDETAPEGVEATPDEDWSDWGTGEEAPSGAAAAEEVPAATETPLEEQPPLVGEEQPPPLVGEEQPGDFPMAADDDEPLTEVLPLDEVLGGAEAAGTTSDRPDTGSEEEWGDEFAGDEEADAFFAGSGDEPSGGFFSRRRARKAAEAAAVAGGGVAGEDDDAASTWEEAGAGDEAEWPAEEPQAIADREPGEQPLAAGPVAEPFEPGAGKMPLDAAAGDTEIDGDVEAPAYDPGPLAVAGEHVREEPGDETGWPVGATEPDEPLVPAQAEGEVERAEPQAEATPIEPLSAMPLLDEDDDRIEVTPIGDEPGEAPAGPASGVEPPSPPASGAEAQSEGEDEYGEWRGEGSRVPSSWFADIDEDEVEIEDLQPADADEPAPVLEAGGMFDVGHILDPIDDAAEAEDAGVPATIQEEPFAAGPSPTEEPPDLFAPAEETAAEPDLLGAAAALLPEDDRPEEPSLWDEPGGTPQAEPPLLPGGGAEPWDAPPLVPPAEDWADQAAQAQAQAQAPAGRGGDDAPEPGYGEESGFGEGPIEGASPLSPAGDVYDVVEDDLDRAPEPVEPLEPLEPVEITEDIYSGAVTMEHRGLAEAIAAAGAEDTELTALSAAMPGLDTGVVGFEDVEDLGTDEIYVPPARSDLGARIVTGIILIALLGASMWTSGGLLAGFIGIMVLIGLTEYFTTLRHKGYTPLVIFGYLGGIGALAGTWVWGPIAIPGAIAATTGVVYFFYAFAPRRREALVNGALTVLGMAWVTGTVAFAMPIAAAEDYRVLVFALVASTVAMDVGAYGFGRAWGSAPMAPVLSPNKSIEGLAGGVVLSIGMAVLIGYFFDPFTIQSGAALGLVVAVAAPLGDLAESMFKRSLGVKDLGAILPGHGGIMDRVDSFLFVIPPVWVLYEFLGYLT